MCVLTDGTHFEAGHQQIVVSDSSLNDQCNQAAASITSVECSESVVDANSTISTVTHDPVVTATPMNDHTIEPDVEQCISETMEIAVRSSIPNDMHVSSTSHDLVCHTNVTASASLFTDSTQVHDQDIEMKIAGNVEIPEEVGTDTLRRPPLWNFRPSVCQESVVSVPIGETSSQSADYSVSTGSADLHLQLSDDDATSDVVGTVDNGVAAESIEATKIGRSSVSDDAVVELSTTRVPAKVLSSESEVLFNDPDKQMSVVSDVNTVTVSEQQSMLSSTVPGSEQQLESTTAPDSEQQLKFITLPDNTQQ